MLLVAVSSQSVRLVCPQLVACALVLAASASLHTRAADAGLDAGVRDQFVASGVVDSEVVDALEANERTSVLIIFALASVSRAPGDEGFDKRTWDAIVGEGRDAILAKLPEAEFTRGFHYTSIRAVPGTITVSGILRILDDPRVVQIAPDRTMQAKLTHAVPFVRLAATQSLGFSGEGVTVAVLDTGIEASHPDLSDDLIGEQCFCTLGGDGCCPNGALEQSGPGSAADGNFHGTYVSGIITSRGVVAPTGGAPDASILAVKVLSDVGFGDDSGFLAALDWILNARPDVDLVNMSVGRFMTIYNDDCDQADPSAQLFGETITSLRVAGVPLFAASGNDGSSYYMNLPACIGTAFSVAASYDDDPLAEAYEGCDFPEPEADAIACFSNTNSRTDLAAPGVLITATDLGGGVATASGTSAAAPVATAGGAVLKEAAPTLTPFLMELALESPARILDERSLAPYPPGGLSFPRVDCLDAVMQVLGGTGLCPSTPRAGCRQPTAPLAAKVYIKNRFDDDTRDLFKWDWRRGAATTEADWGNPGGTTSFSLCVYEGSPAQRVMNLFLPAAGTCAGKPCWKQAVSGQWTYKDRLLSPSGISSAKLFPGEAEKAKVQVRGKGPNLLAPSTPLDLPVRVQMINHQNNVCWEAQYGTASTNSVYSWGGTFYAKSD